MKKPKQILASILAFVGSTAFLASCSFRAPGSSKPIESGDEKDITSTKTRTTSNVQINKNVDDSEIKVDENVNTSILDGSKEKNSETSFKDDLDKSLTRKVSPKFIDKSMKINYVAFGDSISAGFDAALPKDYLGEKTPDGEITGASWPAFLARLLDDNNRVESFKNYAYSGSRIIDWIKILDIDYNNTYGDDANEATLNKMFGEDHEAFRNEFKARLAKSNLVTLTLGANDFFFLAFKAISRQNIFAQLKNLNSDNPNYEKTIEFITNVLNNTIPVIKDRLTTLIAAISTLAPEANIDIVAYPMAMTGFIQVFSNYFKNKLGNLGIEPLDLVLDYVNKGLYDVANQYTGRINIINPYNPQYWKNNAPALSDVYFDIHPNMSGYKKMAMDIYLKLTTPTFNVADYNPEKYNFTQKYLLSDGKSTYQIEPLSSNEDVLGDSTQAYLEKHIPFVDEVDKLRTPMHYGRRLLELSKTFQHVVKEVINFATNNEFYNQIDPEGKLKELILDTENNGQNGIYSIISSVIDSEIIQQGIYDFQMELSRRQQEGILKLEDIPQIIKEKFLTTENLLKFISAIAKSNFINHNKAKLIDALNTVFTNLFKNNAEIISGQLSSYLVKKLDFLSISPEDAKDLITSILKNSNFSELVNSLVSAFINNSEQLQDLQTIDDLISVFFHDENAIDTIAQTVAKFFWDIVEKPAVKNALKNLLWNIITTNELQTNLTKDQSDKLIDSIIGKISLLKTDEANDFITSFIKEFIKNINQNGTSNPQLSATDAFEKALDKYKKAKAGISSESTMNPDEATAILEGTAAPSGDESNPTSSTPAPTAQDNPVAFTLLNIFVKTNIIQDNSDFIVQLIKNIFAAADRLNIGGGIINAIPADTLAKVEGIIPKKQLAKLVNHILVNQNTQDIFNSVFNNLVNYLNEFEGLTTFRELFEKLFSIFDADSISASLKKLANDLLTSEQTKDILKNVVLAIVKEINLNATNDDIDSFADDFVVAMRSLLTENNLLNNLIDKVIEVFNEAKAASDPSVLITKIPTSLKTVLLDTFNNDITGLIGSLINKPVVTNHKNIIAQIAVYAINELEKTHTISNLVKNALINLVDGNTAIEQFVDKNEIKALINTIASDETFNEIIPALVPILSNDLGWIDLIAQPKALAEYFFAKDEVKNLVTNTIKPIILRSIPQARLAKTLVKVVKFAASELNAPITTNKYDQALESSLGAVFNALKVDADVVNGIDDFITNALVGFTTLDKFVQDIPTKLKASFDLARWDFVKKIFAVEIPEQHLELLKELAKNTYQTLKNEQVFDFLINKINLGDKAQEFGVENSDVITLIKTVISTPDFDTLVGNALDLITTKRNLLASSTSVLDFINKVLKDSEFITNVTPQLKIILSSVISNPTFKAILVKGVTTLIKNNENISWVFENVTNLDQFISRVFDLVDANIDQFNIIQKLINSLNAYAQNGNYTNITDIISIIGNEFKQDFSGANLETNVIQLLKLASSNLINDEAVNIKTIIFNIYNKLSSTPELFNSIYDAVVTSDLNTQILHYTSKDKLQKAFSFILNSNNFREMFSTQVDAILGSISEIQNVNSFNDLLKLYLSKIDLQSIKNQIDGLITEVTSDSETTTSIIEVIKNAILLHVNGLYNGEITDQFITDFVNNIIPLAKSLNIYPQVIDVVSGYIEKAKTAQNSLEVLNGIGDGILELIKNEFNKDKVAFINKIIASLIYANNKEYLKFALNFAITSLVDNEQVKAFIANQIDGISDENVSKYLNKDALKSLVNSLLSNTYLPLILKPVLDQVIEQDKLPDLINNPVETIFQLIKSSNVLESKRFELVRFTSTVLYNQETPKILKTAIDAVLKDNLLLQNGFSQNFYNKLIDVAKKVISIDPQIDLISKFVNIANEAAKEAQNNTEFITKFVAKITTIIDFTDFKYLKAAISANLLENDREAFEELVTNLLNKFLILDNINKLLQDKVSLANIAAKLHLTEDELRNSITELVTSDDLKAIIKTISKFVVNNHESFASATSYSDLVKVFAKNKVFVDEVRPKFINLINQALSKSGVISLAKSLLIEVMKKETLAPYFQGIADVESFATNIVGIYNIVDKHFNISEVLFNGLVNYLAENGTIINTSGIISSIGKAFKLTVGDDATEFEKKFIATFKDLIQSPLFTTNKQDIITLIDNVFQNVPVDSLVDQIFSSLSAEQTAKINEFTSIDTIKKVATFILRNRHFNSIFVESVKNSLNHLDEFNSVEKYADIIKIAFKINNPETIKAHVVGLIEDILTSNDTNQFIKDLLSSTLAKYGIDIEDEDVARAITDLSGGLKRIFDAVEVGNDIIGAVFDKLIEASKLPDEEILAKIQEIPDVVKTILSDKITSNPKAFIKKIINVPAIQNNSAAISKIVKKLYSGLRTTGDLAGLVKLVTDAVIKDESPILKYVTRKHLNDGLIFILSRPEMDELVKEIVPYFVERHAWVEDIDNPLLLIDKFLKSTMFLTDQKDNILTIMDEFLKSDAATNIVLDVTNYFIESLSLDMTGIDRAGLTKAVLSMIVPWLKSSELYNDLVVNSANTLVTDGIAQFPTSFVNILKKAIFRYDYKIFRALIVKGDAIPQNRDTIYKLFSSLLDAFKNNDDFYNNLYNLIGLDETFKTYGIEKDDVIGLVKFIANVPETKDVVIQLLDHIFDNWDALKEPYRYSQFFRKAFEDNAFRTKWFQTVKGVAHKVLQSEQFRTTFGKLATAFLKNSEYSSLLKDIDQPELLFKHLSRLFLNLDQNFDVITGILDIVINDMAINGLKPQADVILPKLKELFVNLFKQDDFQSKIITVLKLNTQNTIADNQRNNLVQFIVNAINYFAQHKNPGNIAWNFLPEKTQNWIEKNLFSADQFAAFVNRVIQDPNISSIVGAVVDYYIAHPTDLDNVTSFFGLVQTYIKVPANKTKMKQLIKDTIKSAFVSDEGNTLVSTAVNKFLKFLEIEKTTAMEKFIGVMSTKLAEVADRIGVFDWILDAVIGLIEKSENDTQFFSQLGATAFKSVQLDEWRTIAAILRDPVFTENKDTISQLLKDIINALLSKKDKISEIVTTLNPGYLVLGNDNDPEKFNKMVLGILNSENLRSLLNTIVDDGISRTEAFASKTTYLSAMNELFRSPNSDAIKNSLRQWLVSVFQNKDDEISQGVALIAKKTFNNLGFAFTNEDLPMLNNVIKGLLAAATSQNVLSDIINAVYDNLKAIDFETTENRIHSALKAIVDGSLSIILSDNKKNISFAKILAKKGLLQTWIATMGDESYVKFINRLFTASSIENVTGIYDVIISAFDIQQSDLKTHTIPVRTTDSDANNPAEKKLLNHGFELGTNIFDVVSQFKDIVRIIYKPIFSEMKRKIRNNDYNINDYRQNDEYKAMFRITTVMLWILKDKAGISDFLFWNGSTLEAENLFLDGTSGAFTEVRDDWRIGGQFARFNSQQKRAMGSDGGDWYNYEFLTGNRSNSTNNNNYWRDQVLAYLYYRKSRPQDRHTAKTKTDVLLDMLVDGMAPRR
ncbi:hypothetical protein H9M94_01480 [Mycoplasma sp. Pen4]|uniref:GDSL-type esterase/lipase family protein n=1 Tax=Mycoplasma sp. Pen4 TaxID=640330 RepID=UPI001654BE4B|nr:GDSL-type esterase/lipase family protein [Mycoplasma sp. Pen4]QNM93925.1 hypothetical protein H9M94_01480 [Mycoplasma sp. Pen4]